MDLDFIQGPSDADVVLTPGRKTHLPMGQDDKLGSIDDREGDGSRCYRPWSTWDDHGYHARHDCATWGCRCCAWTLARKWAKELHEEFRAENVPGVEDGREVYSYWLDDREREAFTTMARRKGHRCATFTSAYGGAIAFTTMEGNWLPGEEAYTEESMAKVISNYHPFTRAESGQKRHAIKRNKHLVAARRTLAGAGGSETTDPDKPARATAAEVPFVDDLAPREPEKDVRYARECVTGMLDEHGLVIARSGRVTQYDRQRAMQVEDVAAEWDTSTPVTERRHIALHDETIKRASDGLERDRKRRERDAEGKRRAAAQCASEARLAVEAEQRRAWEATPEGQAHLEANRQRWKAMLDQSDRERAERQRHEAARQSPRLSHDWEKRHQDRMNELLAVDPARAEAMLARLRRDQELVRLRLETRATTPRRAARLAHAR